MEWWVWLTGVGVGVVGFQLVGAWLYVMSDGYTKGYRAGRDDEARVRGDVCSNFTIERDGI